jgi:hypothetical protein
LIFVLTDQKKVGFDKLHLSVNIFYRDVKFLMFCKNINMNITLHIQYIRLDMLYTVFNSVKFNKVGHYIVKSNRKMLTRIIMYLVY